MTMIGIQNGLRGILHGRILLGKKVIGVRMKLRLPIKHKEQIQRHLLQQQLQRNKLRQQEQLFKVSQQFVLIHLVRHRMAMLLLLFKSMMEFIMLLLLIFEEMIRCSLIQVQQFMFVRGTTRMIILFYHFEEEDTIQNFKVFQANLSHDMDIE